MANTAFPGQHTTEVTTTEVTVVPTIRFDPTYIKTIPGALKVAVMFLNILGFICVSVSYHSVSSRGSWFCTVSMTGFWFTGILLVFYLFHVIEKFYKIPWLKIEFVYCAVFAFFYLLAASLAAGYGSADEAFAAAAFFGFFAMVIYGYDAYLKYKGIKAGLLAQGDVTVQKQTVTTA